MSKKIKVFEYICGWCGFSISTTKNKKPSTCNKCNTTNSFNVKEIQHIKARKRNYPDDYFECGRS